MTCQHTLSPRHSDWMKDEGATNWASTSASARGNYHNLSFFHRIHSLSQTRLTDTLRRRRVTRKTTLGSRHSDWTKDEGSEHLGLDQADAQIELLSQDLLIESNTAGVTDTLPKRHVTRQTTLSPRHSDWTKGDQLGHDHGTWPLAQLELLSQDQLVQSNTVDGHTPHASCDTPDHSQPKT